MVDVIFLASVKTPLKSCSILHRFQFALCANAASAKHIQPNLQYLFYVDEVWCLEINQNIRISRMDFLDHFQKVLVKYFYNEPQILKWHHRRDSDIKGMGGAVRSSYQSNVRKFVSNH